MSKDVWYAVNALNGCSGVGASLHHERVKRDALLHSIPCMHIKQSSICKMFALKRMLQATRFVVVEPCKALPLGNGLRTRTCQSLLLLAKCLPDKGVRLFKGNADLFGPTPMVDCCVCY